MLTEKIRDFFKDKEGIVAVYLFGSYAEGKERPFSDIDIGVLLNENDRHFVKEKRNEYMTKLSRVLRKDVHLVILNSAGEELIKQIFLKGECILVNDAKKLSYYKMVMLSKIVDFAFYREQMQSGLIRSIMKGE